MKIVRKWTSDSIRCMCIDCRFYTRGDNRAYSAMLEKVSDIPYPTDEDVYEIAKDIEAHSTEQTVSNVMFHILNSACVYLVDME